MTTKQILESAKKASKRIMTASGETKNTALKYMAESLREHTSEILRANRTDMDAAKGKIGDVMLDRLMLNESRIEAMAKGIEEVALLDDPVGKPISSHVNPKGITIDKVSCPMGVIAIIYESRPNVTSDAAALAVKSGNACVLRCGKEAHRSADAITKAVKAGLEKAGFSPDTVMLIEDTTRQSAAEMMVANEYIDLLIPRGGKGLIKSCVENATVPCIETGTGICHIYVSKNADLEKALNIVVNAKTSRPSVCNAAEVCVIDEEILPKFMPMLEEALIDKRKEAGDVPVEIRSDEAAMKYSKYAIPAKDEDFDTEFLDYILAVKTVSGIDGAIAHIEAHSTHHSDAIITENTHDAMTFTKNVDSAAVYVNASTRFTDGGEFGLGCEMGISTQKLHARGPMGLTELTTYKYIVYGNGTVR